MAEKKLTKKDLDILSFSLKALKIPKNEAGKILKVYQEIALEVKKQSEGFTKAIAISTDKIDLNESLNPQEKKRFKELIDKKSFKRSPMDAVQKGKDTLLKSKQLQVNAIAKAKLRLLNIEN